MGSPQQSYATGSYSDLSTADITSQVTWSVSDTTVATVNSAGLVTIADAGKIWGGVVGLTATLAPGTPGTASIIVVASDSGSVAPRMPMSNQQWVVLGLSPWGSVWGLQEPTGSLVGSGSAAFTLVPTVAAAGGNISYRQVEPLWTRTAIVLSGTNSNASPNIRGTGPDIGSTSLAMLGYVRVPPGSSLGLFGTPSNGAANVFAMLTDTAAGYFGGVSAKFQAVGRPLVTPIPVGHADRVHPLLMVYNRTANEAWAFSDIGITMSGGLAAAANTTVGLGAWPGSVGGAASGSFLWFAVCTGSVAETYATVSGSADLLSRLGWNPLWRTCPTDSGSIKLPYLTQHWQQLGQTPWTATWNLQEPVGTSLNSLNVWDGKNVAGWTLVGASVDTYGYMLPGWSRQGIQLANATSHRAAITDVLNGSVPLWNPTGSIAMLVYGVVGAVGGSSYGVVGSSPSALAAGSGGTVAMHGVGLNKRLAVYCSGSAVTGSQNHADGRVHPFLLVYDATNGRVKGYSDLEAITGSYQPLSLFTSLTSSLGIGGISQATNSGAVSGTYVYLTICTGSQAEDLSDDGRASAFFKAMGWTGTSW